MQKRNVLFARVWACGSFAGAVARMLVGGLAFAACVAPMPLVRLTPESPNVTWVSGLAVVAQEQTGVRIALAFDREDGGTLAFRVEIVNETPGQIEVSPRDLVFVTCTGPTSYSSCSPRQSVIDPEAALRSIDESHSREIADATNNEILGTSLLFLSLTADVASLGSHTPRSGSETASISASVNSSAALHQSIIGRIEGERSKWAITALRRTTLFPARALAGYVYVPTNYDARFVWVQVKIGARRFPFVFEQATTSLVRVTPPSTPSTPSRITG